MDVHAKMFRALPHLNGLGPAACNGGGLRFSVTALSSGSSDLRRWRAKGEIDCIEFAYQKKICRRRNGPNTHHWCNLVPYTRMHDTVAFEVRRPSSL